MKKLAKVKAPVETKEETPQASNLKDDIKEIKELLKVIAEQISKINISGGF